MQQLNNSTQVHSIALILYVDKTLKQASQDQGYYLEMMALMKEVWREYRWSREVTFAWSLSSSLLQLIWWIWTKHTKVMITTVIMYMGGKVIHYNLWIWNLHNFTFRHYDNMHRIIHISELEVLFSDVSAVRDGRNFLPISLMTHNLLLYLPSQLLTPLKLLP